MSPKEDGVRIELTKQLEDIVEDMDDIIKLLPYAKHALTVFKWAKKKRMIAFLRSLSAATDELNEESRKRFTEILGSEGGAELLSEYIDSVLRTSSRTSNAGLAILYADCNNILFSKEFKLNACYGLVGITEELVDYFLMLFRLNDIPKAEENDPYQVYFMNRDTIELIKRSGYTQIEDITHIVYVEELIRRKLLYPDLVPSRWVGEGFIVPFGIGSDAKQYCKLLNKARQLLT